MIKTLYLIPTFLLLTLSSFAEVPVPLPVQLTRDNNSITPEVLDHDYQGCPANSHCGQEQGAKRFKWTNLLQSLEKESPQYALKEIESFRQKEGLPINVWAFPKSLSLKNLISWNSSCPNHNKEVNQVFQGEMMVSNLSDIPEDEMTYPHRLWLETTEKKIQKYLIAQGSSPTMIVDNQLYFTRAELGIYYGLLISATGSLKVSPIEKLDFPPREVACPKNFQELRKSLEKEKMIFQDFYCRALWNKTLKSYQIMMLGWSC